MALSRLFAFWLVVFAASLLSEPSVAATEEQLFATCRSYDVPPASAAAACQALGYATRKGEKEPGKVIDWPKALWFHDRACTLGDADGCIATGYLYSSGKVGMSGNPPQPGIGSAFSYYQRACELSPALCFVVAAMHERGKGTAKNLGMADTLYTRACRADAASCGYQADFMLRRTDVKPDQAVAATHYQMACDKGRVASACASLAAMAEKGQGRTANPVRAAQLRQTACTLDKAQCPPASVLATAKPAPAPAPAKSAQPAPSASAAPAVKAAEKPDPMDICYKSTDKLAAAEACETIAIVFEMDLGSGADHEAAGRLFHRACSLGSASGCRNLGTKFSFGEIGATGNPPAPNHKLAVVYFRKACTLDANECSWLGGQYETGEGIDKDLVEAQRLYDKSCAAKDGYGCYLAAQLMGKVGNHTPAQILQFYTLGCDYDNVGACAEASRRYANGVGVKANPAKAKALQQRACSLDSFKSLEKGFCPKTSAPAKSGS